MLSDIAMAVLPEDEAEDPPEETEQCDDGYDDHPEPHEQEDLLVEDVVW